MLACRVLLYHPISDCSRAEKRSHWQKIWAFCFGRRSLNQKAIIAGEASGDKLGATMMNGFESLKTADIDFIGVGGPDAGKGLQSLSDG